MYEQRHGIGYSHVEPLLLLCDGKGSFCQHGGDARLCAVGYEQGRRRVGLARPQEQRPGGTGAVGSYSPDSHRSSFCGTDPAHAVDDTVSQCHHQFCVRQTSEHRPDLFGVGKSEVCAGLDEILQLPHRGDVRERRWARLPRSGLSEVSVRWDEALGGRKYAVLVAELPVEVWNAGDDLDEVATLSRPAVYDIQQSPNESAVSVAGVCDYELRLAGRDGHL